MVYHLRTFGTYIVYVLLTCNNNIIFIVNTEIQYRVQSTHLFIQPLEHYTVLKMQIPICPT